MLQVARVSGRLGRLVTIVQGPHQSVVIHRHSPTISHTDWQRLTPEAIWNTLRKE